MRFQALGIGSTGQYIVATSYEFNTRNWEPVSQVGLKEKRRWVPTDCEEA